MIAPSRLKPAGPPTSWTTLPSMRQFEISPSPPVLRSALIWMPFAPVLATLLRRIAGLSAALET